MIREKPHEHEKIAANEQTSDHKNAGVNPASRRQENRGRGRLRGRFQLVRFVVTV